jgi:hypothetical protein
MQIINTSDSKDQNIAFLTLPEIPDKTDCKIILSVTNTPKTVSQICRENNLPRSSTYKKNKRLLNTDLITIERANIDDKGKRVIFYKSKVKSFEFNLQAGNIFIKFNTTDVNI